MRFQRLTAALAAAAMFVASATPSQALDVSPMIAKLTPSGSGSSYRLTVRNSSASAATVEVEVYRMAVDETGARTLTPEDEDIAVFPLQSVIPANREQVVQVRYVGEATEEGRMYMVRIAQLPINMQTVTADGGAGADVKVAFTINTYAFVAPASARAAIEVSALSREDDGDIVLTARNTGTGFAYLREATYTLTSPDGDVVQVPAAGVDVGVVSVMPGGSTRQIRIPASLTGGASGDVSAAIALL